ncbi:MAG: hypothetical protein J0I06_10750 [Planctomycetes bacterium]|nr:hypothetical protein [Planctomycetota bacterium]
MNASVRRLVALLLVPITLGAGCGQKAGPLPTVTADAAAVSTEPGRIELTDPVVTFTEPNLVRFEVKYRFTQGRPDKYYLCEVTFPGTPNTGMKPMSSWELKPEGVIKDGIVLTKPPVTTFAIKVSEATSPQAGFTPCSNVVSGDVK